jgi:hypothetical protein
LLRCMTCGHTVECNTPDLVRFAETTWLKCCGEVMALFLRAADAGPQREEPTAVLPTSPSRPKPPH